MTPQNPIGCPFFELSEVDSTNNYAMRQVQEQMAGHGATWFAHYQNSGKGQRGKGWKSAANQNIAMSILAESATAAIENPFFLTVTVALACFDFFQHYALTDSCIKWPNDLYWRDRKAGGILIENTFQGKEWKYSIIGIGININQTEFPSSLPNPVSLKQVTGKNFNTVQLAKHLCQLLEVRWQQLINNQADKMLDEYNKNLYRLGEFVSFKKEAISFDAEVKGVNAKGELLALKGGVPLIIPHGEREWIVRTN